VKKIALFNHKGGVGKTTLTINIAEALADNGRRVLLVDADPQCNLTSFYMPENLLEKRLAESDGDDSGGTIWTALRPVAEGQGAIGDVTLSKVPDTDIWYLPGDVLLSEYEEVLPEAWTECFAKRTRGYEITTALSKLVHKKATEVEADVVFYDVGPNVGALNRVILLDCDYFITPVAADFFSLRALSTVGRAVAKWISDWGTVRQLASQKNVPKLLMGRPRYLGYITSAFKVNAGRNAANPHASWEARIAPRVRDRIVKELSALDKDLVPSGPNKIGGVKNFHSLAPQAQEFGIGIGSLKGHVNPDHSSQIKEAQKQFGALADEIARRAGI
jgi:cellulose biosynthesis protein BcsQ